MQGSSGHAGSGHQRSLPSLRLVKKQALGLQGTRGPPRWGGKGESERKREGGVQGVKTGVQRRLGARLQEGGHSFGE